MNVLPNRPSRKAKIITLLCNISDTEMLRFFTRNDPSLVYLSRICNEATSSVLLEYKFVKCWFRMITVYGWAPFRWGWCACRSENVAAHQLTWLNHWVTDPGCVDMHSLWFWKPSKMNSLTPHFSLVDSGWNEVDIWRNPVLLICCRSAEESYEANIACRQRSSGAVQLPHSQEKTMKSTVPVVLMLSLEHLLSELLMGSTETYPLASKSIESEGFSTEFLGLGNILQINLQSCFMKKFLSTHITVGINSKPLYSSQCIGFTSGWCSACLTPNST